MEVAGAQIRAARAFLGWTRATLADKAGVGISTVQVIEDEKKPPAGHSGVEATRDYRAEARAESLAKIVAALVAAGITFLPEDSRGKGIRGQIMGKKSK
jgi:transcriptional regulator with XRE-family HTH domain